MLTPIQHAQSGLQLLFIADALSMPVHWYYNPGDITREFPCGIRRFEAAPAKHPSSIMNLHSTSGGGRGGQSGNIVGDVILKGKLLSSSSVDEARKQIAAAARSTNNANITSLLNKPPQDDSFVVGGPYSLAC